jgi:hypothetical protein
MELPIPSPVRYKKTAAAIQVGTLWYRRARNADGSLAIGLYAVTHLPVYPDERTFSVLVGMSQRCQEQTSWCGSVGAAH